MLKQLIKLCPTLARAKDINEPIQRMEKAYVMNGGKLTKNPVKNAVNYLLSIQEKHEQRTCKAG